MQLCMRCQKPFINGEHVIVKCLASFQKFVDGMHAIDIIEEREIQHEGCEEEDD